MPAATRHCAVRALLEDIGLVSLRLLAPLIGELRQRHQLNILGIEVLAAALHLEADAYLSTSSPRLEQALRSEPKRRDRALNGRLQIICSRVNAGRAGRGHEDWVG